MPAKKWFLILPILLLGHTPIKAEALSPFYNVFGNLGDSFWGTNSLYHVGAVGSTIVMVKSGADDEIQKAFYKDPIGKDFGTAGFILGWFWQIVPAGVMYFWGMGSDADELETAGAAGIQAIATVGLVTMLLKYASGRKAPLKEGTIRQSSSGFIRTDRADDFKLFNTNFSREEGRFFWPSGHTSSTIAFVSAMVGYYPNKTWIAWVGYPLTLLMGLAVLEHDSHWASDVVAGALIGHAIGYTTGRNFRRGFKNANEKTSYAPPSLMQVADVHIELQGRQGGAALAFSQYF